MTDEQQLRDQLEAAVPEPPDQTGNGRRVRVRWRRTRRRRVGAVVAVAAALAVGIPAVGAIGGARHETLPSPITGTVVGSGNAACRELGRHQKGLGYLADSRVVDRPTATAWLRAIHSNAVLGGVAGGQAVDVCLFYDKQNVYAILAGAPGRSPVEVARGKYNTIAGPLTDMQTLDQTWRGGATTTDAPFRCPGTKTPDVDSVSSSLPSGSTGALLCYENDTLYSPRAILSEDSSDRLVAAIDGSPISYQTPNIVCTGIPGFREYAIVFRYPTGTRVVRQEQCRGLAVGPFTRDAPYDLDQQLERLLLTQGKATGGAPACPPPQTGPHGVGDLRHIVSARFCAAGEGDLTGQPLSGHQLAATRTWGAELEPGSTGPDDSCPPPAIGWPHLTFLDAWGNSFTATVECPRHLVKVLSDSPAGHWFYPDSITAGRAFHRVLLRLTG